MGTKGGNVGVAAVAAIAFLACVLTAPAWLPKGTSQQAYQEPAYQEPTSGQGPGILDWFRGLFAPSPAQQAEAERIRQLNDIAIEATRARVELQITADWERLHPTSTPTPQPTPTPEPNLTNTVNTGTGIINRIALTVLIVGLVIGAVGAAIYASLILKRESETYQKRATGATIKLSDGTLALTEKVIGPTITPQPQPIKDLLVILDRWLYYFRTGKIRELPKSLTPLLNDAHATSHEYAAVAINAAQADALAVGLSNTLPEDERLKRIEATKRAGLRPTSGHGAEMRPWNVTKPADISVMLPGGSAGFLEAAQEQYLERMQPQNDKASQVIDGQP